MKYEIYHKIRFGEENIITRRDAEEVVERDPKEHHDYGIGTRPSAVDGCEIDGDNLVSWGPGRDCDGNPVGNVRRVIARIAP